MTDPQEAIAAMLQEARLARTQGRLDEAARRYAQAADLSRASREPLLLAHALRHVSDIARECGNTTLALQAGEEAVALYRAADSSPLDLANALRANALALQALHASAAARALWEQARPLYLAQGVQAGVAECDRHLR
jgi:hypothetical protein